MLPLALLSQACQQTGTPGVDTAPMGPEGEQPTNGELGRAKAKAKAKAKTTAMPKIDTETGKNQREAERGSTRRVPRQDRQRGGGSIAMAVATATATPEPGQIGELGRSRRSERHETRAPRGGDRCEELAIGHPARHKEARQRIGAQPAHEQAGEVPRKPA